MFYIDQQRVLHGSKIILNWQLKQERGIFLLWIPISRFFWNNYSLIKKEGHIELLFSGPVFTAKIKKVSFFQLKPFREISDKTRNIIVRNLDVNTPILTSDSSTSVLEISHNKLFVNGLNSNFKQKEAKVNSKPFSIKNLNYFHQQL